MKTIKIYISALLLMVCSAVNAQKAEPYLNVEVKSGVYKSYPVTANLKVSWGDAKVTTGKAKALINNKTTDVKWVQLWAGGPKFAEYNVGATSISEYGNRYAWGGSQNVVDDHYTGSGDLSGTNDTATKLWGPNWRMPTQAERDALFTNCTIGWTDNYNGSGLKGAVLTGKGIYAVNSIFFPCGQGVYAPGTNTTYNSAWGIYWCATSYSSTEGCDYRFNPSGSTTSRSKWAKAHCMFVRAVLNE